MKRRYPTTLAALMLLTAACSGSDESSTATSAAPDSTAESDATDVETEPAAEPDAEATDGESGESDDEPAPEATAPPTTAAATTTTSTTAAPRPITIAPVAIDAGLDIRPIKSATDLITLPGDPITAIAAGSVAEQRGSAPHAATWWSTSGSRWDEVALDDGGATESIAYGVGGDGDLVAVVGVAEIDGVNRSIVWRSSDRGATFGTPEFPIDEASLGADIAFVGGAPLAVSWRVADDGRRLVASRTTADGWTSVELPVIGREPVVSGIQVIEGVVIVTGRAEIEGRVTGVVWRSADAGASFEVVDDPAIAASSRIGAPTLALDGVVATAARPDNGDTVLVTSTDGVTWREIGLSLDAFGRSSTATNGGSSPIAVFGDQLAVGIVDQVGGVAVVGSNGNGTYNFAPYNLVARFSSPKPFVLSSGLFVLGSTATGFVAAQQQGDSWSIVGQPGPTADGPNARSLELWELSAGAVAEATSWPLVEPSGGGGIVWSSVNTFLSPDGSGWAIDEEFPEATVVATDGASDIAFVFVDDPGDDDLPGPSSGTAVSIRSDGTWSETELILSGPGGDYIYDSVATDAGFVAVGTRYVRSAQDESTSSIVIMEESDGAWNEVAVADDLGDRAELYELEQGGDGSLVSSGWIFDGEIWRPLVMRRTADGWARVLLPTDDPSAEIRELIPTEAGVEIVTNELDSWFRYVPQPDGSYVAAAIELPNPATDFPGVVVDVDGRRLVIGSVYIVGLRRFAIWELTADGSAVELEVDAAPTGADLSIDSAIVLDGTISVSGTSKDEHVIWEIDLGDQ